jgi:hypothetical protein
MTISRSRVVPISVAAALLAALFVADVPAPQTLIAQSDVNQLVAPAAFEDLKWRNVGASRGGRVTGFAGVRQQPHTFYAGATGGGVWKTDDAGIKWVPMAMADPHTGSIGSIDVAPRTPITSGWAPAARPSGRT